jgi:hypothetical protein
LLLGVHQLPANGDRLGGRFIREIVHRLQPPSDLLDGEVLEVEEGLDRDPQQGVLLRHGSKQLLHRPLLREIRVSVTMTGHLLLQSGKSKSKVLNLLTGVEGEILPVLANPLQRYTADAVDADARCSDGVPCFLGGSLVSERRS